MKFTDVRTLESVLVEYGMNSGSSTPTSQQQTGATAKANATSNAPKPKVDKGSPTVTPGLDVKDVEPEKVEPTYTKTKAKDIEVDAEYHDDKGEVVGKVISKVGNSPNPDKVVVQDPKGEYQLVEPDEEVQVLNASKLSKLSKSNSSHLKLNKIKTGMKKLVRKFKLREQGDEQLFEINFNKPDIAKAALDVNIKCGFEAETVWNDVANSSDDEDWLDDENWYNIEDYVYEQEGSRSVEAVQESYREWMYDKAYEYESDIIQRMVSDRKEDEEYIDAFVDDKLDMDEVEEYKESFLASVDADDRDEFADWDLQAFARQYAEEVKEDELIEWLEESIRDNGEAMEEAVEQAEEEYPIDTWASDEHGSWLSALSSLDIYLHNPNSGGGVEEVAAELTRWTDKSSEFKEVEAGEYHSGYGADQTYWRVEDDSSIESDGGTGAELISPVYDSPRDMLHEMKSMFEWMSGEGVETNRSCGLHVTMSLNSETPQEVNKVKLAVLLGDKYLLSTFGRSSNSYAKSQYDNLKKAAEKLKSNPEDMKSIEGIERIISSGISTGKFSSINFKTDKDGTTGNNLIEFRIGGGDDYHTNFDIAAKAVIRYAATMSSAYSDQTHNTDYAKALFKLINSLDAVDPKDEERIKGRFDVELPIVDTIKPFFSKGGYIDSMDHVAVAVNNLTRYRKLISPGADEAWKEAVKKWETETGSKHVEEATDGEPITGYAKPRKLAPSKEAPAFLKKAQEAFVNAIAQAGYDLSQNLNRGSLNAKAIGVFRNTLKDFELDYNKLDTMVNAQADYVTKDRDIEQQALLSRIQNGVNRLFKKAIVTLPAFLTSPQVEKIVKGLWRVSNGEATTSGEQGDKFFKAIAKATNQDDETIAYAWDQLPKREWKVFYRTLVNGSYNSAGINKDGSWFKVGNPVNEKGVEQLIKHLDSYEDYDHPVAVGHNPNGTGDDDYTDNALSKMIIKLRARFDELTRIKETNPAMYYDSAAEVSELIKAMTPKLTTNPNHPMTDFDPALNDIDPHRDSDDGLDYFGMTYSTTEELMKVVALIDNQDAPDPFTSEPMSRVRDLMQQYLRDVFDRHFRAKNRYGADVFDAGNLPAFMKSRTDAISKFINGVDKISQKLGFDSANIDVDKKTQLMQKQKKFMDKHGEQRLAKLDAWKFGGDVYYAKSSVGDANKLKDMADEDVRNAFDMNASMHKSKYRDVLVMPHAHKFTALQAQEIYDNVQRYGSNWRYDISIRILAKFKMVYEIEFKDLSSRYVSWNEDSLKTLTAQKRVKITDELGDGRIGGKPYDFAPLIPQQYLQGPHGEPFDLGSAAAWASQNPELSKKIKAEETPMNKESAFDKFDKLPLEEQINIISKISKEKIDKIYEASKDIPSGQHLWNVAYKDGSNKEVMASSPYAVYLQLAPGVRHPEKQKKALGIKSIKKVRQPNRKPKGSFGFSNKGFTKDRRELKKAKDTEFKKDPDSYVHDRNRVGVEENVPDFKQVDTINDLLADHFPVGDLKKQMLAYQAIPVPAMLDNFRRLRAEAGDDACARNILQMFVGVLPDATKAQINLSEWSKQHVTKLINEYTDLSVERDSIIKVISQMDVTDKQQAQLIDKIYRIINSEHISTTIGTAFSRPLDKEPMGDAEKLKIKADMAVVIAGLDSDYAAINQFLDQLAKTGSVVNIQELAKPINTLSACLNGSDIALQALQALSTYGVGKKQKGPGEYALAILSDQIHLATGEGDLEIEGIGKVELKAANSSAGGRIGYGGGTQKMKRDAITPYAEYIPTIMAHIDSKGGSIGLRPFIQVLNIDLPIADIKNQEVRKAIMTALLVMDMEIYAGPIIDKIATSENIVEIESIYLQQNFLWYKNRDAFDALLLIHIPNRKTAMIRNEQDLAAWHRSGHAQTLSVSIIPTQAGAGREQWAQLTINKGTI